MENLTKENENATKEIENVNILKQRHGCVTAWLIFWIIGFSLVAIIYLFAAEFILSITQGELSKTMIISSGIIALASVVFTVLLLRWKKIGFWGYVGVIIVGFVMNLNTGSGIVLSLLSGLISIAILYGVLQIKKNNVSAWENLE